MRAIRRFTVAAALPEPIAQLGELMMNLRWSWHAETMELFAAIDREQWAACGHDPVRLLGEVPPEQLERLAEDRRFLRRLSDAADDLHEYLAGPRWYQMLTEDEDGAPAAIAYFSPEFGITAALPQYSGGLGILAGDHLKTASDLGVPLIGVGLLYRHGYFRQSLSREGWQQERYPLRSEEYTSELQSRGHLVCRLLLEKKNRGGLSCSWEEKKRMTERLVGEDGDN